MANDPAERVCAAPEATEPGVPAAQERVARGVVAAHRARLDWLLRVPAWAELIAAGAAELGLPGRRQGIGAGAALMALALENKYQLVRWTVERFRHHLASPVGRRMCRIAGLEAFSGLDLEDTLSGRQWGRLREALLLRLGHEHRRYKHAQQLLFMDYRRLVDRAVAEIVFRPDHRADAAQEGALGLLQAIDRVDDSERPFSAYALAWIRRSIRNHLMRQRLPVHAPVNLISETASLVRPAGGIDRAPADEALTRMQSILLECLRHPAVSLDEPLDERGATAAGSIADQAAESPAELAARADARAWVRRAVGLLTDKQREVLERRFGLRGRPDSTLSQIAAATGISHQQVSMRERRALQRLETALAPLAAEMA